MDESLIFQDSSFLTGLDFANALPFSQPNYFSHEWLFDADMFENLQGLDGVYQPSSKAIDEEHHAESRPFLTAGTELKDVSGSTGPEDEQDYLRSLFPIPATYGESESNNPWPMEWHADDGRLRSLPAVEVNPRLCASRYYALGDMTQATWIRLRENIQLTSQRSPWCSVRLDRFPSSTELDTYIDLYFAKFNAVSLLCAEKLPAWADCYRSLSLLFILGSSTPTKRIQ